MNVRLAESCRENPLELTAAEFRVRRQLNPPVIPSVKDPAPCNQEIFLSFFFDGTNNNKYRDTPDHAQSNVARLFEACLGTPSRIKPTYGGRPDLPVSGGVHPQELKYYRKSYIPGLGSAFPEIKDTGQGHERTGGLGLAMGGEARIVWALLQITEHLHQILVGCSFPDAQKDGELANSAFESREVMLRNAADMAVVASPLTPSHERVEAAQRMAIRRDRMALLRERAETLAEAARYRLPAKPKLTRIHISAFGFSRGAAEARVFVNWLLEAYGGSIVGIPLQIDFLGVFDTVASVGLAHGMLVADGHMGWADGENLAIPSEVRRCVHLVSAHEVRGSFPLDSVCRGNTLPANCKEVVYPGVHADVGGGYPPKDQGRSPSHADKLSQIALAQMYREARIAGVRLALPQEMGPIVKAMYEISPSLKQAFNAYITATRKGKVEPAGLKDPLFPEETQPPATITDVMRQQYAHYLAWRKLRLGNIHQLPDLQAAETTSRIQDIEDIKLADEELQEELKLLQQPALQRALKVASSAARAGPGNVVGAAIYAKDAVVALAQTEKFEEWKDIEPIWRDARLDAQQHQPIIALFDRYVHDSRAWFKLQSEDDANWFPGVDPYGKKTDGQLKKLVDAKVAKLEAQRTLKAQEAETLQREIDNKQKPAKGVTPQQRQATLQKAKEEMAECDREIEAFRSGKKTYLNRGKLNHEFYYVWGYLRWRKVYTTGTPAAPKRIYKGMDRAEQLRELDKRHSEYMTALLKGVQEGRQAILHSQGNVAEYDQSSQSLIRHTTEWMTKERQSI
ncbi:T6SS phospholipase effector Tle1-like catalytic domain-containing protein [Chitinimonas sp. BJB300]|uniref:T6SS phospholipase effector Tle1-like catalytic domain-containing protein n=1 Tax=Chitinimonas sp. BJB300 TaxID=1559339 RepID=UPI000C0FCFE4|nr:DUF2235 domain-containing protein [Chitinimonas sp. BJB300]PHV11931.1 hypothetical protein CSQ89_08390 [Chitinimonas sp. BJB300]TSJ84475.1 hypothetical protein FG002_020220 [Chitinimonas sp. BJB300]